MITELTADNDLNIYKQTRMCTMARSHKHDCLIFYFAPLPSVIAWPKVPTNM